MDGPVIMAALPRRWRYAVAPAMGKEMFAAHFFPAQHGRLAWATNSLNYYLAVLFFNAFPLPQREAGARQTLRYIGELLGEGTSVMIFPEGRRSENGVIDAFRPGIGMIASRLNATVVPVRLEGLQEVLRVGWRTSMGVRYPDEVALALPPAPAGIAAIGSAALTQATGAHRAALGAGVRYAAATAALTRVRAELLATRRRLRGVEDRLIPRLEETLRLTELSLDEIEREEGLRLRWAHPERPTEPDS